VLGGDGAAYPVRVDRCAALRPQVGRLSSAGLAQFQKDCPAPQVR